ncbi:PREDICTED: uncharacterized protein LOC106747975 isoform X2 [Dinoponera quadriceps]|uniref:Chloride channel CLIC-like protein 1 n=1 Tax=Dinoponera quadriceps TaxID=609295 RepID=A0A6P3XU46_DINQU|nr:PREDICTED: uncharacterized protein LOC106747975 isoform X2 [Dinoponera quadriceps]
MFIATKMTRSMMLRKTSYCRSTDELHKINNFFYKLGDNSDSFAIQENTNNQYLKAVQSCKCEELDERNTQEAVFYKRMVAILLSNLDMQRVDDKLIGTLSMEASSSQYEYLQNFVEGQGSIKEVDKILVNVIKPPDYTASHVVTEMFFYFNELLELLIQCASIMKEHWNITIISAILISSFMVLRKQRWSRGLVIFLLFDVIFVTSFFITWWQLIQEAEIELMAAQTQFAEMPISCQPHKMGTWDKITTWFSSTNECEKYYKALMTNPKLQVTPAFALTHFLTKTIFHPLSYFGVVMSEFINNVTSKMNFMQSFFTSIIICVTFCICVILLPLFLLGGSFNFGFGPFFRFGIKGQERSAKQERIERIYENNTSPKKHLKGPEKMKQITLEPDPAAGDAGVNTHHSDEELDEKQEEVTEGDKKKEGVGDC